VVSLKRKRERERERERERRVDGVESLENFGCVRVKEIKRDSSLWWGTLRGYIGSLALLLRWGSLHKTLCNLPFCPFPPSITFLSLFSFPFLLSF